MNPSETAIVSIPYSGTRFLRSALNIPRSVHTYVPPKILKEYIGDARFIFAPLREPRSNWDSWARRWPKHKHWDRCIGEFERSWMGMAWLIEHYDVHFIPLDLPDWEQRLNEAQDTIGIYPHIPTEREGSKDEGDNVHPYDVKHIYRYEFVKEFYNTGE